MKGLANLSWLFVSVALAAAQLACGSSSDAPASSSAAGSAGLPGAAGAAGSSAGAGAPAAGAAGQASAGTAGTIGSAGTGGNAGSSGSAGTAGTLGISGSAGASGAAPFGVLKCNPTGSGDGKQTLVGGEGSPAPAEWTLKAGVTAGTVTLSASFASQSYLTDMYQAKVLHFPYWIYTSANYVPGKPAILLLMGDGNQFLTQFHFATVLDNLSAAGDLPPTVALFVDPPTDGQRVLTYDPPTDTYTKFLFDELLPSVVFGKYTVSRDPNAWAVVGYSASGGQGWKVLWNRPDDIHKFIGFNTSFGAATTYNVNWVSLVSAAPARPQLRVSLLTSSKDIGAPQGDPDPRGDWQAINTNMAMTIAAKGGQSRLMIGAGKHYEPVDGEHDLPNALRWTFQGCSF